MAKKKKNEDGTEKGGSKVVSAIIVILIIVVWLAILAVLVKADVGHFGSNVLRPVLKDVPVINKILPAASEDELVNESDYEYATMSQALARIAELETENSEYKTQIESLNETITDQTSEIERLKVFEENQEAFQTAKDQFYTEIVYGDNAPDTSAYVDWYNQIDSANAELIYSQILGAQKADLETQELAKSYSAMKPEEAAAILEEMTNDLDSVANILNSMSSEDRGKIMAKMNTQFAANITKKLLP